MYILYGWDPFQLDFLKKKSYRFKIFIFMKSIYATFKSENMSYPKLFFEYIDFTTL